MPWGGAGSQNLGHLKEMLNCFFFYAKAGRGSSLEACPLGMQAAPS